MKNQKGFSLLEIIVAIFFVGVILVPLVSVITFTLGANKYANHRLIAANLAQEGIEIVRNIRDSETNWNEWYGVFTGGDKAVEYDKNDLLAPTDNVLNLNAGGFYTYNLGSPTIFSRKITLTKISDDGIQVVAIVNWKDGSTNQSITVEDRLYNWNK